MSYLQAFVIALVQGVTELFPVSSLGHSVLIPAWVGVTRVFTMGGWLVLTLGPEARRNPSMRDAKHLK